MCVGLPMRVVTVHPGWALCDDGAGGDPQSIDTMLVGEVRPGVWLMTFLGAAREVMDETSALRSRAAVDALAALLRGEAVDLDVVFADLVQSQEVK